MSYDRAELSALRWAIACVSTSPEEWRSLNRQLEAKIARQRQAIRKLVAYYQRAVLTDEQLERLIAVTSQKDIFP